MCATAWPSCTRARAGEARCRARMPDQEPPQPAGTRIATKAIAERLAGQGDEQPAARAEGVGSAASTQATDETPAGRKPDTDQPRSTMRSDRIR